MIELYSAAWSDDRLQIQEFPGARILKLTGPRARRVTDLALHQYDLGFALQSLEAINSVTTLGAPIARHVQESLWRSAIMHFFKCFGSQKGRSPLDAKAVFKGTPPEVMMVFDYFRALRDKHLVHDENYYAQCIPGAVLAVDPSRKVEKITATMVFTATLTQDNYSNLHTSVRHALAWVDKQFETNCSALAAELEARPREELEAMPDVGSPVTASDVDATRSRP